MLKRVGEGGQIDFSRARSDDDICARMYNTF